MEMNENVTSGNDELAETSQQKKLEHITYARLLGIQRVALGALGECVVMFSIIYIDPIVSFVLKSHGLTNEQVGASFLLIPLGIVTGFFPSSLLASRGGEKRVVIIIAALAQVIVCILYGPSEVLSLPKVNEWLGTVQLRLLLQFLCCAAYILFLSRLAPEMIDGAKEALPCEDEDERKATEKRVISLTAGFSNFGYGVGVVIAPVMSAELYDRFGLGYSSDGAAVINFLFVLAVFIFGDGVTVMKDLCFKKRQQPKETIKEYSPGR